MNLIPCGNLCVYQIDGYCQLKHPIPITGIAVKGCCYFVPKEKADKLEPPEKPKGDVF